MLHSRRHGGEANTQIKQNCTKVNVIPGKSIGVEDIVNDLCGSVSRKHIVDDPSGSVSSKESDDNNPGSLTKSREQATNDKQATSPQNFNIGDFGIVWMKV
ncbi:hypothetical protein PR048_018420 [Dryococelus australis]|uniref:Uncharacterized protein n=1 Tax=Dryococelus australis TaxID=614101 RepID=A0ABQ9HCY7_9NEOP|nr:hypothetical protein PR048_018420 [Dryococelus australis]